MTAQFSSSTNLEDAANLCPTVANGSADRRIYGTLINAPATPTTVARSAAPVGGIASTTETALAVELGSTAGVHTIRPTTREHESAEAGPCVFLSPYGGDFSTYISNVRSADMADDNEIQVATWDITGTAVVNPTQLAVLALGARRRVWQDRIVGTDETAWNRCLAHQNPAGPDGITGLTVISAGTYVANRSGNGTTSWLYTWGGFGGTLPNKQGTGDFKITLDISPAGWSQVIATAWKTTTTDAYAVNTYWHDTGTPDYTQIRVCTRDEDGTAVDVDYVSILVVSQLSSSAWTSTDLTASNLSKLIGVGDGETPGCTISYCSLSSDGTLAADYPSNNLTAGAHVPDSGVYRVVCTEDYDNSSVLWFVSVGRASCDFHATVRSADAGLGAMKFYVWDLSDGLKVEDADAASVVYHVIGIGV